MKKLLAIILAVAMLLCFAGCGSKKTDDKVLKVATNAEFEPFESLDADGNYVGFDVDMINAIAEKIGYTVEFDNMEFDGVIAAVASGSCDIGLSGLTINAKRAKSVDFSDAYYNTAQILIVGAKDTYFTGTTKEELDKQLEGQAIGVCSGYTGQNYVQGNADWNFPGIKDAKAKIYENLSLAISDLKNGTINAIVMDGPVAKEAAAQNSDVAKVIDVALTVEDYAIAVAKNKPELKDEINAALAELIKEGKIAELYKKYDLK
jgi:ABC-type amino acid transport substrate-binding protein